MDERAAIRGVRTLIIVWLGQLISLIGSGVTSFALSIWVYQRTGSATQFTLSAFLWPAYTAATTLLIPKQHLGRAGGMLQMGQAIVQLSAPGLGSLLLEIIQLQGVILFEFTAYFFALATLLCVRFPKTKATPTGGSEKDSLLHEVAYGWAYLTSRPGLLGLLIFFAASNFLSGIVGVLFGPLVLSFASPIVFGTLLSIAGIGTLVSSLVMSIW